MNTKTSLALMAIALSLAITSCKNSETIINPNDFPDAIQDPTTPQNNTNFQEYLSGEIRPGATPACFAGAYYRKILSSTDYWLGISGTVVLPNIQFDPDRTNPSKPAQYLDNPSVYMGGRSDGQETDFGLTWEVVMDDNGKITPDRRAFRPFYRWAGHSASGQVAGYGNAPVQEKQYFYPGDTVFMSVQIIADKVLRLNVESKHKKFQVDVPCNGYSPFKKAEFKRVNAIDQVSNEGKPAQGTKTKVLNARWIETGLYRNVNNKTVSIPLNQKRQIAMQCPDAYYFTISNTKESTGSETINIHGTK